MRFGRIGISQMYPSLLRSASNTCSSLTTELRLVSPVTPAGETNKLRLTTLGPAKNETETYLHKMGGDTTTNLSNWANVLIFTVIRLGGFSAMSNENTLLPATADPADNNVMATNRVNKLLLNRRFFILIFRHS
jgi:hypothetical protein